MKKSIIKTIAAASLMVLTVASGFAKPAKPGIRQWTQADGTVLNVQVVGDEHHHFYLSEDNYLIMPQDGVFYFAEADADNGPVASWCRAENVGSRSADAINFLATLDREMILQTMAEHSTAVRENSPRRGPGLFSGTTFPSTGEQKGLIILVQFADLPFTIENPNDYFHRMLNEQDFSDYYGTGSCRDFWIKSSMGQFVPEFDIYGPVTMPNGYAYYGGNNDAKVSEMVIAACDMLDDQIDFSQYDRDSNGIIDNVYFFYAGEGEATSSDENTIWPHASNIGGSHFYDNVCLSRYACSNEIEGKGTSAEHPDGPGTFCHEFSHVLGLPDLYATNYADAFTPGAWDIMDGGCYNNTGFTPPYYTAQERYALGWIEPELITGATNCVLPPLSESNKAYMIKTPTTNEYYLLENRQRLGWDKYLPGHGMLIWHIDFKQAIWNRNTVNNNASHQYVDIEEADNVKTATTVPGDVFPGSENITSFTDQTTPSMKSWAGVSLNLPITDIKENAPDGTITFKVGGGAAPAPSTTVNAATDVTPRSFRCSWSQVSGAKNYLLSVYSTDAGGNTTYAPGYNCRNVGTSTSAEVSGLEPSTAYVYSVIVVGENSNSNPSNEMAVNTLAITHEYVIPTALDATTVQDEQFTANWEAVDGADNYLLDVCSRRLKNETLSEEGFDNKTSTWFSSSSTYYTNTSYSGKKTPSLKLTVGDYVCSPYAAGPVRSFQFWHRGASSPSSAARLVVEAYIDECWTPIAYVPVSTSRNGVTTTLNSFPEGTASVRVLYNDPNKAASVAYVDDMSMTSGGEETRTPLAGYSSLSVNGSQTAATVSSLNAGTDYFYTVKAVKDGVSSMASLPIFVHTTGVSGIDDILGVDGSTTISTDGMMLTVDAKAGQTIAVCDMSGRIVYLGTAAKGSTSVRLPAKGAYVVKVGAHASTILVK